MDLFDSKIDNVKLGFLGTLYFFTLPLIFLKIPSGILVSDIVGIIIIVNLFMKRRYYMNRILFFSFLFFLIGSIFAMFQNPDIIRSVKGLLQQALVIFMLYPIMKYYIKNTSYLNKVLNLYKNGALLITLLIILYHFFSIDFGIVDTAFARSRTVIGDTGPNVVARILVIGALISLYFSQIIRNENFISRYYFEFVALIYGVFSTASVSGVLLLGIGTLLVLYRYNLKKDYKNIKRILALSSLGVTMFLFLYNKLAFVQYEVARFRERFFSTFRFEDGLASSFSSNTRLTLLSSFMDNIDKYFIFGIGYNNSNYISYQTIHFPLVAALVEIGIIGFIGVLLMYSYPIYKVFTNCKISRWNISSILAILIILGDMIQPNPNYRFTWFAILLPLISIDKYRFRDKEVKQ